MNFTGTYISPALAPDGEIYDCCDSTRVYIPELKPQNSSFATGVYTSPLNIDNPGVTVDMLQFTDLAGPGVWLRPWPSTDGTSLPLASYPIVVEVDLPELDDVQDTALCSLVVTSTDIGMHVQVTGVVSKTPDRLYRAQVEALRRLPK